MNYPLICKIGLAFILYASGFPVAAQQTFSPGTVTIFNHKTDSGSTKPIAGAQIDDDFGRVQSTMSDDRGYFGLYCYNVKEKTRFPFRVVKPGLEVVNIDALMPVAGQSDTIRVSMALPDQAIAYRRALYHTGLTNHEKGLAKKIKMDDDRIRNLTLSNSADSVVIDSLRREIAILHFQEEQAGTNAETFVEKYGSIDLDYAPTEFQEAFRLFKAGLIDSALNIMRRANPKLGVEEDAREADSLAVVESEAHRKKLEKIAEKNAHILDLRFEADLFTTKLEYDSALACYQTLLRYDPNRDKNYFQCAFFYNYFHKSDSAIKYYQLTLAHSTDTSVITATLNNLAGLWELVEKYAFAYHDLQEGVRLNEQIWQRSRYHLQDYAMSLANLGQYFYAFYKYDSAVWYDQKALFIYSTSEVLSLEAQHGRIITETNLGMLFGNLSDFSKAIVYLKSAMDHDKSLLRRPAIEYDPGLVSIGLSLANIYLRAGEYANAHPLLEVFAREYEAMGSNEKVANISQYARIEYNLGQWATITGHNDEALQYLGTSFVIRKGLYKRFPGFYDYDYILILSAFGRLYQQRHLIDSATSMVKQSLDVISAHQVKRVGAFEIDRANALGDLASFLWTENDYVAAIDYGEEALEIYQKIAGDGPTYLSERLDILSILGVIYYYDDRYRSAIECYKMAISLFPLVPLPRYFRFDQISENIYHNLGACFEDMGLSDSAKVYLESARLICLRLKSRGLLSGDEWARLSENFGNYYLDRGNPFKARDQYFEAYHYYEGMVKSDTTKYEILLGERANDLGNCYNVIRADSAEYYFLRALQIPKKYIKLDLKQFAPQLGMVCNNLGFLMLHKGPFPDFSNAENYFMQAKEAYRSMNAIYPNQYDSALVISDYGLGLAQRRLGKTAAERATYQEMADICSHGSPKYAAFFSHWLSIANEELRRIGSLLKM